MEYEIKSNGFISILDIHFGKLAKIRLDSPLDAIEYKFEQVLDICKKNGIYVVTIAGDVFENCSVDRSTFVKACKIFNKFKKENIKVFSIFGNHDEYRYNKNFRDKTPLNDLSELGLIELINSKKEIRIDTGTEKIKIKGFDFLENDLLKKYKAETNDCTNVLIGHLFYENEFLGEEENITKEEVKEMNLDYLILGHDHSEYKEINLDKTIIIRNGSLLRSTTSKNDIERNVNVIWIKGKEHKKINLNCKELSEIVIAEKIEVKETKDDKFRELIEDIQETGSENESIEDFLQEYQIEEKYKAIIRRHLK